MGRRGNQTFLKNQKAQKRVARANAKRNEKQAKRDEKASRAAAGETGSGPPIEWGDGGGPESQDSASDERDAEAEPEGDDPNRV